MTLFARVRYYKADLRAQANAAEFSAPTHKELVAEISSRLSFPSDLGPQHYMESFANRASVWSGQTVRTSSAEAFLVDLKEIGAIHLWSDTGDTYDHPLS